MHPILRLSFNSSVSGGVLSAVLVQAALLVFIMLALLILASASNIKQSNTLQDVMHTVR